MDSDKTDVGSNGLTSAIPDSMPRLECHPIQFAIPR